MRRQDVSAPVAACGILILQAIVLPASAAPVPVAPAAPVPPVTATFQQRESHWLIVAGGDAVANAAAASLGDRLVSHLESVGFSAGLLYERKVVVKLLPGAENAAPRLYTGEGETILELPEALPVADSRSTAEWLVRALSARLLRANGRSGAPAPWLVAALAEEAFCQGVPARVEASARAAAAEGPLARARLDSPPGADDAAFRRSAYWFYRALRQDLTGRRRGELLVEAMAGMPVHELMARFLPESEPAQSLWWPVAFYRLTEGRPESLSATAEAEVRYTRLVRFVLEESGRDIPLDTRGLISRRALPAVRAAATERVLTLKQDLPRVNPLWLNAYVAYGLFLEKLADPKSEEVALADLASRADAEAAAARALSAEAGRVLAGPARR